MIYLKTAEEIEKVRKACALASDALGEVAKHVKPGVTTNHIEMVVREFIHDNGGKPTCLGYHGFPAAMCYEVNEIVVHGFPSNYVLREGDILGTDIVVELDGFNGDMCYTFPVGEIANDVYDLCRTTKESLTVGIEQCRAGNRIGDISSAIQRYCEERGYSVVREMTGHGIGRSMHEEPEIPNYGRHGVGPIIKNGMCLCIEPMINLGKRNVVIERDGWTCRTRDRRQSAHYEHTVAVVDGEPQILTSFESVARVLGERFI